MVSVDTEPLVGLVAVATLPAAALGWIFLGGQAAAVIAIVGWLFLVPVLGILTEEEVVSFAEDERAGREAATETETPLEALRDRYARGDIDEAEFERRLERLLETEDIELPPGASVAADRGSETEGETETVEFER